MPESPLATSLKEGVLAESSVSPRDMMVGPLKSGTDPSAPQTSGASRRTALGLLLGAPLLSACAGVNPFSGSETAAPAGPPQQPAVAGTGRVKVGLILPLSA